MRYVSKFTVGQQSFDDFESLFLWLQMASTTNSENGFNITAVLADDTNLDLFISNDLCSGYNALWSYVVDKSKQYGGLTLYRKIDTHQYPVVLYVNKTLPNLKIVIYREKADFFVTRTQRIYHYSAITDESISRLDKYTQHTYWEYVHTSPNGGVYYFHAALEYIYDFIANAYYSCGSIYETINIDTLVSYFMFSDFLMQNRIFADAIGMDLLYDIFKSLLPGTSGVYLNYDRLLSLLPYDYTSYILEYILRRFASEHDLSEDKINEVLENTRPSPLRKNVAKLRMSDLRTGDVLDE